MNPTTILLYCLYGFLASCVLMYVLTIIIASYLVYTKTLRRPGEDGWGRTVSEPTENQIKMDDIGMEWHAEHVQFMKEVKISRDGLDLYGEYYDLGYKRAVMILSGRTESLRYGYFFARPYSANGCNVLVVDPRAHGLSGGQYNTVGFEESLDALAWIHMLHNTFGVESVVLHGICIGGAGGLYATTHKEAPDYIDGLVTEGMFPRFYESMRNNLNVRKKNLYPILPAIDLWMKHYTGHSMRFGPIDVIHKMEKPLLMLQSREDKATKYEHAKKVFDLCPSENKTFVTFEHGGHSLLRITDMKLYDDSIAAFLKSIS